MSDVRDSQRLTAIDQLGLAQADLDPELQALVAEAAERLDLPISLISIVLDHAQSFAAMHGLGGWLAETRGTPAEWAFCKQVVETDGAFVVNDASSDQRVSDNPLVGIEGIRCYAGVPLITASGQVLGSFCVIGTEPRKFDDDEMAMLRDYAQRAIAHIETRAESAD